MDPNTAWANLINALEEGDGGTAADAAVELGEWIAQEGFVPMGLAQAILALRNADHTVKLLDLNRAIKP